MKKEGVIFDINIAAYDFVCELIGIYMLYLMGKSIIQEILGYIEMTDLPCFKNVSKPVSEN